MDDDRLPPPHSAYRTMGRSSAWERLGVGVMDKAGRSLDHDDYSPATYSLVYVLRGRGSYQLADGQQWDMQAGDCFQRLPGLRHTTHLDPESRWLEAWIDLGPILYRALADMQVIRNSPLVWRWGLSPVRVARFTTLLSEISEAGQRDLPDLCVRCQALIVEAPRGSTPPCCCASMVCASSCRAIAPCGSTASSTCATPCTASCGRPLRNPPVVTAL